MPRPTDDRLMWEAFRSDAEQKLIDEGILDRMKARGAGAKAGIKSIGGRLKGAAQTGVGKMASAVGGDAAGQQLQQMGQATTAGAKAQSLDAKSLSLVNSHIQKLNAVLKNFTNDLDKLGMDIKTIKTTNPEAAAALTSIQTGVAGVANAFAPGKARATAVDKLSGQVNPPAPAPAAAAAPAPAPVAPTA